MSQTTCALLALELCVGPASDKAAARCPILAACCERRTWRLPQYVLATVLLIVVAGRAMAQQPFDFSNKTVDQLIQLIDDDNFQVRQDATAEMVKRLPNLKKDDLAKVVAAYFDGSAEVNSRLGKLLKEYLFDLGNSPKATAAVGLVELKFTKYDPKKDFNAKIQFGEFTGEVPVNVFGKEAEWKVYNDLKAKWNAYRNYISIGDTDGAAARLDEMKKFVDGLTRLEFSYLTLQTKDGKQATKDDVLEAIGVAKYLTKQAKEEIQKKMGAIPDPRPTIAVAAAGPVNLGKTVALNVGTVIAPGTLDYTWTDTQFDYGPVPSGYLVRGPIYDLLADDKLTISGAVSISIQYGSSEGNAYGITDPSKLAVFRIGGDGYQFLDAFNDLGQHTITAVYSVSTPSSPVNIDQFGEFILVMPGNVISNSVQYTQVNQQVVMVTAAK